jgi:hypothetical protein
MPIGAHRQRRSVPAFLLYIVQIHGDTGHETGSRMDNAQVMVHSRLWPQAFPSGLLTAVVSISTDRQYKDVTVL